MFDALEWRSKVGFRPGLARLFHPFKVKLILPPSLAELVVGVRIRIDIKIVDWEPPVCADDARG